MSSPKIVEHMAQIWNRNIFGAIACENRPQFPSSVGIDRASSKAPKMAAQGICIPVLVCTAFMTAHQVSPIQWLAQHHWGQLGWWDIRGWGGALEQLVIPRGSVLFLSYYLPRKERPVSRYSVGIAWFTLFWEQGFPKLGPMYNGPPEFNGPGAISWLVQILGIMGRCKCIGAGKGCPSWMAPTCCVCQWTSPEWGITD